MPKLPIISGKDLVKSAFSTSVLTSGLLRKKQGPNGGTRGKAEHATRLLTGGGPGVIDIVQKIGYEIDHQTGSHIIMRQNKELFRRLTVPNYREISKGTLRAIIRQAGLTRDESFDLL
jgi:predicted RNA binding protein YcfA (HicA-like mRNA interferase family)